MQVTKPKKQRKRLFQAPDHVRYRKFSARLSPELRASHETKTVPARSGDSVRIMRGDFKGFEGKITRVDRKKYRIYVEGLRREKVDGTTISVSTHPSKVMITDLNLEDKWRKQILERKKEAHKVREETLAKTPPDEDIPKRGATEERPKTRTRKRLEKKEQGTNKKRTLAKKKSQKVKEPVKRKRKTEKKQLRSEKTEKTRGGE